MSCSLRIASPWSRPGTAKELFFNFTCVELREEVRFFQFSCVESQLFELLGSEVSFRFADFEFSCVEVSF